ncbi:MAG: hypothetical protein K6B41_09900, partial [Butyrivibrio sp.]|nr:hypothetical protein [Butyrivibrio sp.]
MNKGNLQAIFDKYINGFDKFNDFAHAEFFKWKVCTMFPELMNKALNTEDENFSKALFEVKKCTYNIIDGYT